MHVSKWSDQYCRSDHWLHAFESTLIKAEPHLKTRECTVKRDKGGKSTPATHVIAVANPHICKESYAYGKESAVSRAVTAVGLSSERKAALDTKAS